MKWLNFIDAKIFVKTLNIKNSREWILYKKNLPKNLPKSPNNVYAKEWISWSDFLGNSNVSSIKRKLNYVSYVDAKNMIQEFKFNRRKEFLDFYKDKNIKEIPGRPDIFYKEWEGWGIFLGNNNLSSRDLKFIDINKIIELIKLNGIKSRRQWYNFYKENKNIYNIPIDLKSTYKRSYIFFFGNNNKFYFKYNVIKYLCEYYRVNSISDWNMLRSNYKRIPHSPSYYSELIKIYKKPIISYEKSKLLISKMGIKNIYDWINLISTKKPKSLPRHPNIFYKEWKGWEDFLGYKYSKKSIGETLIKDYLLKNNIEFISQKTFSGCVFKNRLRFDFFLPNYNTVIEFDGGQHFKSIDWFGGESEFINIKIRDSIKNKYCLNNNIKLIRIPFFDMGNINKILSNSLTINLND
jgi:hypothetical protein